MTIVQFVLDNGTIILEVRGTNLFRTINKAYKELEKLEKHHTLYLVVFVEQKK